MNTADNYAANFYDKKVSEINTDLASLGWIQYMHPVANIGEDEEGTFPEVYMNDGTKKSIRIFPSGDSLSFFEIETADQIEESELYAVNMGLIVWADLTKVYPAKTYNYTPELLKDVKDILDDHSAYNYSFVFRDVFANYSQLEKVQNQNTMLPYSAFKINFTVDLLLC